MCRILILYSEYKYIYINILGENIKRRFSEEGKSYRR